MTPGIKTMLTYSAGNLATITLYEHSEVPPMVKELVKYGWMTWHARGARLICMNADTADGATMTANTIEMPV